MKSLSLTNEPMKAAVEGVSTGLTHCGSPVGGTESELMLNKQKMEHMRALIKHYQSKLETQVICREGMETVSRLLFESRQENAALKKQHAVLQMTIKNLQNKLSSCGVESSTVSNDNEVTIPSTSQQTLTNLALENKRLRSLLQQENNLNSSEDLNRTSEDIQTEKTSQETVDHLEAENQSLKRKISDLEGLFKSSNNEKDRQLILYEEKIQRLAKQTGETTAHTTVHGASALKEQLRALMSQCANFESHLENVQQNQSATDLVPAVKQAAEGTDSVDGAEVQRLQDEKLKLQARVEEVTQMNQRWQEFFNERDRYTKALEQKVQELDGRLKEAMHNGTNPKINQHVELILQKSEKEVKRVEDMRKKAEDDVERLRQEVILKDAQISQLQGQVSSLRQATHQPSVEVQSVIEHLKAQIQVCTEDFQKEREDRQLALQKVNNLQEQNSRLQKLNNHFQTLLGQSQKPAAQGQGCYDTASLLQHCRVLKPQSVLVYDGPSSPEHREDCQDHPDFGYQSASREHVQQHVGPVSLPAINVDLLSRGPHKPRHSLSDSALHSESSFLTCPKCNKEFSEERQGELLAHMDVCWE